MFNAMQKTTSRGYLRIENGGSKKRKGKLKVGKRQARAKGSLNKVNFLNADFVFRSSDELFVSDALLPLCWLKCVMRKTEKW